MKKNPFLMAFPMLLSALFLIASPVYSENDSSGSAEYDSVLPFIGSVPTPDNLEGSHFEVEFNMYNQGGVNGRIIIGLFDFFSVGVSENMDYLIGSSPVRWQIPGAYAKISLFPKTDGFNIAAGFDTFGYGDNANYIVTNGTEVTSSVKYGFFLCGGSSYTILRSRNIFSFGLRIPLLPEGFRNIRNSSIFVGATLGVPTLYAALTIENFYVDFTRFDEILPKLTIVFAPAEMFRVGVGFAYDFGAQVLVRHLSLTYTSEF